MENFKQIAEDCLAGKLSGTFVLRNGKTFHSQMHLSTTISYVYPYSIAGYCYSVAGNCYSSSLSKSENDIINFIPDMKKKEQITIDIPEGMEVVREETPDEIKIKFVEKKKLSYKDIENKLPLHTKIQTQYFWDSNVNECNFSKKVEMLRKLTNIRNYFGKPTCGGPGYIVTMRGPEQIATNYYRLPVFAKKEHAEQAIKMLGDELKYLFEPW